MAGEQHVDTASLSMKVEELIGPNLRRLRSLSLGMLVVGAVLSGIGFATDQKGFFPSYLFAWIFWTGVSTGSLALLLLHHTVGGGWGFMLRRFLEAGAKLTGLALVLAIPVAIGLLGFDLYEWNRPDTHLGGLKEILFQAPFFLGRMVFFFAVWMGLGYAISKRAEIFDQRNDAKSLDWLNRWGAGGLVIYALTTTFAGVDWVMSLTPHWYSTIYGLLFVVSNALSAMAVMLALIGFLGRGVKLIEEAPGGIFRDLGNLMLAMVMLWAYMSFSQLIITYAGNTTEEVGWYLARWRGGWPMVSIILIPVHFFLPFFILLTGSSIKKNPRKLGAVALFIVIARLFDLFWWVQPTFRSTFSLSVADIGAPLLIGGIWLFAWGGLMLRSKSAVPLHDPRLTSHLPAHAEAQHG